jgi:hypothetical protein
MKNPFKFFVFLIICAFAVSSCGDDDNPTNTTQPGTVLYSLDSISVWFGGGVVSSGSDSVYYSTQNSGGVRVEFHLQSNADSSDHSQGYYGIYTNATPVFPLSPDIYTPIDSLVSINLSFASGTTYFAFSVRLSVSNSSIQRYVRLTNIKVIKQ